MSWETVIGLEVHCELSTRTKLFCSCPNEFGAAPNTNVCPVCLGLPGSLPVLNERVVEFALRLGEALEFEVPAESIFARKNYFYPDMPKDYQVSQYEQPILVNGRLEVDGTAVGIHRAHLEEDTGKTAHISPTGRIHDAEYSLVDYNRAGVPLMEIVSEPEIRSSEQARSYVQELRATLEALGVSDVKMEEGSLRIDANVSLRPDGASEFGTKVEVKNMNSLRSLGRALDYEVERQRGLLEAGEAVVQETRHWDEGDGRTKGMRSKEEAFDYRYFPEPDLVPVRPTAEWRDRVRATMPELPAARRARLIAEWEIREDDARTLLASPEKIGLAEAAVALGAPAKRVANIVINTPDVSALSAGHLAELVALEGDGTISKTVSKQVLDKVLAGEGSPREIVEREGLANESDEGELASAVDAVVAGHPDEVAAYREGDEGKRKKIRGFLMGQLMKQTQGKADPQTLNRLLDDRLP
ncbi:MAG TPA: Asp-tRNA(Asn)/Glu-tRNA(Gln) amidotransferase subunit GatB [Acidimicrobiia bacterium]|nr:Asp-tRNA(Asn)/Glu-tRNA(Gln) amidotransferase subunit GatB [Acidimicrobiia bacterium]